MYESTWAVFYGKIIWKYSSPARYYPIQSILQTKRASVFSHMSGPSLRVLMVRYACATATLEHAVVRQILEDRQDVRSHKLTSIAKHTNPAALLLNTSSINKPFVFVLSYIGLRTPTTTAAAAAAAAQQQQQQQEQQGKQQQERQRRQNSVGRRALFHFAGHFAK